MTTFGIIGAGEVGSQIARATIVNGYTVVIANSRGPETLDGLIADLGPAARRLRRSGRRRLRGRRRAPQGRQT
ncbi:NAD(P)-binding domain-containing protein [Micromonospora sp. NBC_01638]|uniref:NAD(P)-binding domain-containing protein n=1 Tax=Micromonospora sp. NBC_01638 TaxID=2975982 RepID=UPI0038653F47|nr:NAD(P)-binding domain-containing protein [Micromonospora sp. NBC_01638]